MQGLHLWVHALCQHHRRPLAVRTTSLVVLGGVPDEPAALLLHQRPAHLQLTHRALPVCSSERRSIHLLLHTTHKVQGARFQLGQSALLAYSSKCHLTACFPLITWGHDFVYGPVCGQSNESMGFPALSAGVLARIWLASSSEAHMCSLVVSHAQKCNHTLGEGWQACSSSSAGTRAAA